MPHRTARTAIAIVLMTLIAGCDSAATDHPTTPISLGSVAFSPASSAKVRFATTATPLTILHGRQDSNGDGVVDGSDVDTSGQTREFSYAAATINGVPAVDVAVRETASGATTATWSFALARAVNGNVFVVRYTDGGVDDFTAGTAGAEPVLFLPYDSAGTLVAGTTYPGGFNHHFTPLRTWKIEAIHTTTPLGISDTTDLHVDVGDPSDRHFWFSDSDGIVETDGGFSIAPIATL